MFFTPWTVKGLCFYDPCFDEKLLEVIRAKNLSYISLCVCMELWLYDSIEVGFAWPVISEIGKGSRWPRRLWIAVLRPDVLVKFPSLSIPAICAIRLMILPRHPSSKQASDPDLPFRVFNCVQLEVVNTFGSVLKVGFQCDIRISFTSIHFEYLGFSVSPVLVFVERSVYSK